jgi:hypothetical protein
VQEIQDRIAALRSRIVRGEIHGILPFTLEDFAVQGEIVKHFAGLGRKHDR